MDTVSCDSQSDRIRLDQHTHESWHWELTELNWEIQLLTVIAVFFLTPEGEDETDLDVDLNTLALPFS